MGECLESVPWHPRGVPLQFTYRKTKQAKSWHPLALIRLTNAAPQLPSGSGETQGEGMPLHFTYQLRIDRVLGPKGERLLDGLDFLAGELPVDTAGHFLRFSLAADAHDRPGQCRLPEYPGNCQVGQLFVMILGYGLGHSSYPFAPGIGLRFRAGIPPSKILRVQALQVEVTG